MQPVISVRKLSKSFPPKGRGFFGSFRKVFAPSPLAIQNLSLRVQKGEKVALIGPKGAGKSTILHLLSGVLYPSSGEIKVLGLHPAENRTLLAKKISILFGQKSKLWYHLPVEETFRLLAKMYDLSEQEYTASLEQLDTLFSLFPLLQKPSCSLSFEERMRCEVGASLLHRPEILFLDDPTAHLEGDSKFVIRSLLSTIAKLPDLTLLLASSDTADVEAACQRALVLDAGSLILDTTLQELRQIYKDQKVLSLPSEASTFDLPGTKMLDGSKQRIRYKVDLKTTAMEKILERLLKQTSLHEVTFEDLSMQEIVQIVQENRART